MPTSRQQLYGQQGMPRRNKISLGVTASKTLTSYEQLVHATANTANGNLVMTLAPAAEVSGIVVVRATIANSKTVTVKDPGGSFSNVVLDVDKDYCVVFSDGVEYHVLVRGSVVVLTDNSGGTASDTIAAITDGATKNAVASLAAKVNALLNATFNNS